MAYPVQVSAHKRSTPYGEQPVCDHLDYLFFSPLLSWNLACSSWRGRCLGLTAHSSAYSAVPVCSIQYFSPYTVQIQQPHDNPADQTKTKERKKRPNWFPNCRRARSSRVVTCHEAKEGGNRATTTIWVAGEKALRCRTLPRDLTLVFQTSIIHCPKLWWTALVLGSMEQYCRVQSTAVRLTTGIWWFFLSDLQAFLILLMVNTTMWPTIDSLILCVYVVILHPNSLAVIIFSWLQAPGRSLPSPNATDQPQ